MKSKLNSHGRGDELRTRIAQEAARLMAESGLRDFAHAKRKAAERLDVKEERDLPKNTEIEAALREYQRLFQSYSQPIALRRRRQVAVDAMDFFRNFEPRLVGAVLDGTADEHAAVCLHLFADQELEVRTLLNDQGIPFETDARKLRFDLDTLREFPVIQFVFEDIAIDLTIFSRDDVRQAPLDRIDGKPIERANLRTVRALLDIGTA